MRARRFVLPLAALALAGCDRITGADQQKALDAEAIGYSCRISLKPPEDCIKENETLSPTSILFGWKEAERDIKEKAIDPTMGKQQPAPQLQPQQGVPPAAATENKPVVAEKAPENAAAAKGEKPAMAKSEKPAAAKNEKPAAATGEKPAVATGEKPAAATGKPDQGAAEKKAN